MPFKSAYSLNRKEIPAGGILYFFLFLLLSFGTQIITFSIFPNYAVLIIVFVIFILLSAIFYLLFLKDFSIFLLILNFFPLLVLNNSLHYDFRLELISFIPIFGLGLLSLSLYILNESDISFRLGYIGLPVALMVLYFGIGALIGIAAGRDSYWIFIEFTHICLYLTLFPVIYLLRNREKYLIVMKFLLWLSVIISIEYLIYNIFIIGSRFVTFQSGFLPITTGVMFAYFLFNKERSKKLFALFILLILIAGTFVTLTRTLWIVTLLVMLTILFIYLKHNNKLTIFKISFVLLLLFIPFLLAGGSIHHTQKKVVVNKSVTARSESISNPLGDVSFLMRVELGYYAIRDFLKEPIFGTGIGSYVKYKIIVPTKLPIYYVDSSWIYMIWKGGIVGFLIFGWLFVRFFKAGFFVLRKSPNKNVKIISLGLIGGFIGMVFLGIFSPQLIKYKTNILIAFLFAYIEFERRAILASEKKAGNDYSSP